MPAVSKRTEIICDYVIHGFDVMQYTTDNQFEFWTLAFVHGVIIKGLKLIVKLYYAPLAYAGVFLYSLFKTTDLLYLQRRERKFLYPDPKKHCQYVNLSYVDRYMMWLKQADQMDKILTHPEHFN